VRRLRALENTRVAQKQEGFHLRKDTFCTLPPCLPTTRKLGFHNIEKTQTSSLDGRTGHALLVHCRVPYPAAVVLGRLSWCHVVHVFASYRPALKSWTLSHGEFSSSHRSLAAFLVFSCDSQGVACPCSSSAQAVEVAGYTKSIPCQARLLFELFRNEQKM
jgi:hypothetical protein